MVFQYGKNRKRESMCIILMVSVCVMLYLKNSLVQIDPTTVKHSRHYNSLDNNDNMTLKKEPKFYQPSRDESLIIKNMDSWGWNETNSTLAKAICDVFVNAGTQDLSESLQRYIVELEEYERLLAKFPGVPDIRFSNGDRSKSTINHQQSDEICNQLKLHPKGLPGVFPDQHLSYLYQNVIPTVGEGTKLNTNAIDSNAIFVEYMEPLLPPLRHPSFCYEKEKLLSMGYLIHDFEALCRRQITKPTSRNIFIDMGASYQFHKGSNDMPSIYLLNLFTKFGFPFDHIYAYEMRKADTDSVYKAIPASYHSAMHWINVPVSTETNTTYDNPLRLILDNFNEDDLIIVKLDIDTPSVEMSFIQQILQSPEDGTNSSSNYLIQQRYSKLIDHFYFGHHVVLKELSPYWQKTVKGSVSMSLNLFQQLRKQGIAAHFWV